MAKGTKLMARPKRRYVSLKGRYFDTESQLELGLRALLVAADLPHCDGCTAIGEDGLPHRLGYHSKAPDLETYVADQIGRTIVSDPTTGEWAWTYDRHRGVWKPISESRAVWAVQRFDLAPRQPCRDESGGILYDNDTGGILCESNWLITIGVANSALDLAAPILQRPGFFESASQSISINGAVIYYDRHKRAICVVDGFNAHDMRCRNYIHCPGLATTYIEPDASEQQRQAALRRDTVQQAQQWIAYGATSATDGSSSGLQRLRESWPETAYWPTYLDTLLHGHEHQAEEIEYLQELIGATLLGLAPSILKQGLILWGPKGGGKSMLMQVLGLKPELEILFPASFVAAGANLATNMQDYQLARFRDVLVVIEDEVASWPYGPMLSRFITGSGADARNLTGAGGTTASRKGFSFTPKLTYICGCTDPPEIKVPSEGLERRFQVIRTARAFTNQDAALALPEDEIINRLRAERGWILLASLAALARVLVRGKPTTIPSTQEFLRRWLEHDDPAADWIRGNIELAPNSTVCLYSAAAFERYHEAMELDRVPLRRRLEHTHFGRKLRHIFADAIREGKVINVNRGGQGLLGLRFVAHQLEPSVDSDGIPTPPEPAHAAGNGQARRRK